MELWSYYNNYTKWLSMQFTQEWNTIFESFLEKYKTEPKLSKCHKKRVVSQLLIHKLKSWKKAFTAWGTLFKYCDIPLTFVTGGPEYFP